MRRSVAAAIAGAFIVALAGCSSTPTPESTGASTAASDEELVKLAQEEGQVVVYTGWRDDSIAAVKEAFQEKYGIEVVIEERFSSADLAQRIDSDVRTDGRIDADWVLTTDQALATYLSEEGYTLPVSASDFPGLDEKFVDGEAAIECTVGVPVVGYNTDVLGDDVVIDSWDDLLDPSLSGHIMIADPRNSAAWANTWSSMYNSSQLGEDFITTLGDQDYDPVASSLVGTEQLVAGQSGVLLFGIASLFEPAIEAGQPIKMWFPTDPSPVFFNFCMQTANSDHPNAGLLFFKWFMSEEGQNLVQGIERLASPLGDLPDTIPLPDDLTLAPEPTQVQDELPDILSLLGFS
ncbi:MAG: extracellular solute-binding protein [Microbacterium sp.]